MAEPAKHDPSTTSANETEFLPSFVDLYHECLTPMVRLAWALTGSEVVAEDVVQDAFLRVHAHWSRIENPRAYLRQTVVNACRSASRRARRERTLENARHPPLPAARRAGPAVLREVAAVGDRTGPAVP